MAPIIQKTTAALSILMESHLKLSRMMGKPKEVHRIKLTSNKKISEFKHRKRIQLSIMLNMRRTPRKEALIVESILT